VWISPERNQFKGVDPSSQHKQTNKQLGTQTNNPKNKK
jgi:hypothetical protein